MLSKGAKTLVFVMIASLLFGYISDILVGYAGTNYQQSAGFLEEPFDSLDAVYIGASPTFTSWIAPYAWEKYGIAMRTYSNNSQPFEATLDFLRAARRMQPNAVYLIALNGVYDQLDVTTIHGTTDNFTANLEKPSLIDMLCDAYCNKFEERLEIAFPLVRYHSRWNALNRSSFHKEFEKYKGGFIADAMLNVQEDISSEYHGTKERQPLPAHAQEALEDLLGYCKRENVKVVFVLSAQYRSENDNKWFNTMMDVVKEYGFPVLDEIADFEKIGLDEKNDFYNTGHTNIHGGLKITDYLAKYLIANYGLGGGDGKIQPMIAGTRRTNYIMML